MQLNQFIVIAVGLLLFSLLMLAGGISMYRNRGKADEKRIAEEKRKTLAIEPPPAPAVKEAVESAPSRPVVQAAPPSSGLEILRVSRRPVDGGLTVSALGETVDHAGELDPGQIAQLKRLIREIAMWVEGREAQLPGEPEPMRAAPPQTAGTAGAGPGAPGAGETRLPPTSPEPAPATGAFADQLPKVPEARDMLPFRRKNIPKLDEAPAPPKSIPAQIDEILQGMVGASPFAGHEIRLSEDPVAGLKIVHDSRTYQAIDDVADPAVKALIKKAVQVWNERNKLR